MNEDTNRKWISVAGGSSVVGNTELVVMRVLGCGPDRFRKQPTEFFLFLRIFFFPVDFFFKSLLNLLQYCFSFIFWVFWSQIM